MPIQQIVDYDVPANFAYDPAKIEVVGAPDNVARLVPNPELATFLATLQLAGGDAEVSLEAVTATIIDAGTGSVTIAGSAAEIRPSGTGQETAITWPNMLNDPGNTGAIRIVITPNFTGFPGTSQNQTYFALRDAAGQVNASAVKIRHTGSGAMAFDIYAQNQSVILSIVANGIAFTAGVPVEIEANWDIVAGASRLFLNGVQIGATSGATGSRNAVDECRSGSFDTTTTERPNFDLEGVAIFATPQHTANYTPNGVNLYPIDAPNITTNGTVLTDAGLSLSFTPVVPAGSEIRWAVCVDGLARWYDGGAWVSSDLSPAQSNTVAELNAAITSLDLSAGAQVRLRAIMISDSAALGSPGFETSGDVRPSLAQSIFTYDFFATTPDLVTCIVYGFATGPDELALEGIPVRVVVDAFIHGEHQIDRSALETETDANGLWEIELVETATIGLFPYTFVIGSKTYPGRQVPSQSAQSFDLLATG